MKLAALGVIAVVIGVVDDSDGMIVTGILWIVGGLVFRLVHGPKPEKPSTDSAQSILSVFTPRRITGVVILTAIGIVSVLLGAVPYVFEGDEPWRWVPVVVGAFAAGTQLLAGTMFGLGSSMRALVGAKGHPTHPALIRLDTVTETGMYVNERPRLALGLTVDPQGRPSYPVTTKQVVPMSALGALRVGTTYRGRVDLEVPEGVEIDWHDIVTDAAPAPDPAAAPSRLAPPASANGESDVASRLRRVDDLLRQGAITPAEHAEARDKIIDSL